MKFINTCILLAAAGIPLFAEPSITDGEIKAQFENGSVKVYDQKADAVLNSDFCCGTLMHRVLFSNLHLKNPHILRYRTNILDFRTS